MGLNFYKTNAQESCSTGVEFEIKLDEKGTDTYLTVIGSESKVYVGNLRKFVKELELLKEVSGLSDENISLEQKKISNRLTASMIVDWRGFESDKGKNVEYTAEKAFKLISNNRWIKEQVDAVSANMGKFLKV